MPKYLIEDIDGVEKEQETSLLDVLGPVEAGMNLASQAVALPTAGMGGIDALLRGHGLSRAAQVSQETAEALTYEPRTKTGKAITHVLGLPFETLGEVAEGVGTRIADAAQDSPLLSKIAPELGATVSTAIQASPMLLGIFGRKGLKQAQTKVQSKLDASTKWKSWKEFWEPFSTVPDKEQLLSKRYQTFGKLNIIEDMSSDIFEKTKELPAIAKKEMFEYLDGRREITDLPKSAQPYALRLRHLNDSIGRNLVSRGLLDEETYMAHKGKYVRYLYLKHMLGDDAIVPMGGSGRMMLDYLKARKDLTLEQRQAIGLVEDVSVAEPVGVLRPLRDIAMYDLFRDIGMNKDWVWQPSRVETSIPRAYLHAETAKMVMGRYASGTGRQFEVRNLGGHPLTGLKQWGIWDTAKNTWLGEEWSIGKLVEETKLAEEMVLRDPANIPMGLRRNLLTDSLDRAMQATQNIPEDFIQMPTSKGYGPLAGMYVRKPIYYDIVPLMQSITDKTRTGSFINNALRLEREGMAIFKIGKVALNIPTMVRNVISNVFQMNMSGMPLASIPSAVYQSLRSMISKDQYYQRAKAHGVFKTNWGAAEMEEAMESIRRIEPNSYTSLLEGMLGLAKHYGKIDDVFKLMKFKDVLKGGKDVQTAVLEAQKWGMDYSLAPRPVKFMRQHLMPFVSYPYKIGPLIAETMKERPWVFAKFAAVPLVLHEVFKSTNDVTDKEYERLMQQLPEQIRKNPNFLPLPWKVHDDKSKRDRWQWVDLEYFFPWQTYQEAARNMSGGEVGEFLTTVGMGNPYLDILSALKLTRKGRPPKDPFTGMDIYSELDSGQEKLAKTVEWVANRWMPSMLSTYGALGTAFKAGKTDKYGMPITMGHAAGKLFGFNVRVPSPLQAQKEREGKLKYYDQEWNKIKRDQSVSPEDKIRAMRNYVEKKKEIYAK